MEALRETSSRTRVVEPQDDIGKHLTIALLITLAFVVVEAVAGLAANSLALLTDAGHNFTDAIALGLTWYAVRLTRLPADSQNTYGRHRAGIVVALVNSSTLVIIAFGVFYEAYRRFMDPPSVKPAIMIPVGIAALVVNLGTALLVRGRGKDDLNVRAAFVHLMSDVASTAAAIVAGLLIVFTGAAWLDPLASVIIAILIVYSAWSILREALEILLESTPRDVDMQALVDDVMQVEGVLGVHDLHVWSLTRRLRTMSAHIVTNDITIGEGAVIQANIGRVVAGKHEITHCTLQLECVGCDPDALYCDLESGESLIQRAQSD